MKRIHGIQARGVALVVALGTLVLGAGLVRGEDVTDVVARVRRATQPGSTMRAAVDVELTNESGDRVIWSGRYVRASGPPMQIRLVLDAPPDLRGTTVTVRAEPGKPGQTRLYLPAVRRTRILEGDRRGESFLGTDFNYEDLDLETMAFARHAIIGEDAKAGCLLVESVPEQGWWYGRIVRCIDRETGLPRRTEYYDRAGMLWKIRTLEGIATIDGYPTATVITMRTVPAKTATTIRLSEVEYDVEIPAGLFDEPGGAATTAARIADPERDPE